ncbi:heat shock factor binding protein 1 [Viridothelium virens]|uniref:Heat shock factor binding protein 1 n=1 Tax=Viridothelium virens TaxID=1048519 RepID=A0A6A6HMY5_VIRVR|nr:heat shock factor binding protein 1 [Viridothelium virens]
MSKKEDRSSVSLEQSEGAPAELTAVVDELLQQLQSKFSNISSDLLAKMDDMSRRLDNLEATIQASNSGPDGEQKP